MRKAAFYLILLIPMIAAASIILPYAIGHSDLAGSIVKTIVDVSPYVAGDLSVIGELTPAFLAAALIALAPGLSSGEKILVVIVAVVTYFLYIYLSIFFSTGDGLAVLASVWDDYQAPREVISKLLSNMRMLVLLGVAGLLGFKISKSVSTTP